MPGGFNTPRRFARCIALLLVALFCSFWASRPAPRPPRERTEDDCLCLARRPIPTELQDAAKGSPDNKESSPWANGVIPLAMKGMR